MERLGDGPIEGQYKEQMIRVMNAVDQVFNGDAKGKDRKVGVLMLVFPFGEVEDGRCNYLSNGADRKDVVVLMKEQIARFEGQPEMKGTA